jgi:cell division protein FtsN
MEETTTSWKNHSFTLLVFGGIVVLCSIFFVLGMLVGRNQGQRMAENSAEKEKNKPVAVTGADDFTLNYYSETREEKPDLKLQPAPPEPPTAEPAASAARAVGGSSSSARLDKPAEKQPQQSDKTSSTPKAATPKKPVAKTPAPPSPSKDRYLQVVATKDQKQAKAELKKVQSKGFKALIMEGTVNNERWHRVVVGPYKESDIAMATSDLKATGYKDVVPR